MGYGLIVMNNKEYRGCW